MRTNKLKLCKFQYLCLLLRLLSPTLGFVPTVSTSSGPSSTSQLWSSAPASEIIVETPRKRATWSEVPIDQDVPLSEELTVGERLKAGETVITLRGIISDKECEYLRRACTKVASSSEGTELEKAGLVRLPTIEAWERAKRTETPCADPLPPAIDALAQDILGRVTEMIDIELNVLVETLFVSSHENNRASLAELVRKEELKFSSREPAINVYTAGGEFLAHKDAQALTVLLPLSSPKKDFDGGGTAFWSQDSRGHRVEDPSLVLKPKAGTVLLFGGCVTHAGQSILDGTRVVLVASFSPLHPQGQGRQDATPQRDIYGDSM